MQSGDAACKVTRRVEESGVAVGNLHAFLDEAFRNALFVASHCVTLLQQFRRTPRPYGPVAQETAHDAALFRSPSDSKKNRRDDIDPSFVIVAGIERDVASSLRRRPDNIERLVAIERSNFDGDHALDFRE